MTLDLNSGESYKPDEKEATGEVPIEVTSDHEKEKDDSEDLSAKETTEEEELDGRLDHLWNWVSKRPKKAYAVTCGSYCSIILLLLILILTVGSSFFPFSSEVPLYLRGHVTRIRKDALTEGKEQADYTLNLADLQLRQSVDTLGGEREDLTLEIIYLPKYGDVLETKILQKMVEFEKRVMAFTGFDERCFITYSDADIAIEKANNEAATAAVNARKHPCHVHHTILWACDPSLGAPCSTLASTPIGLMNCNKSTTCTPEEFVLEENFKISKVHTYANSIPDRSTPVGLNSWNFLKLVDSQFGPGNQIAKAVRTEFTFGAPLKGYKNVNDNPDGQSDDLAQWLYDDYHSWLGDGQIDGDVTYLYNGHGMFELYLNDVLIRDGMFAIASMIFVLIYIAFMTSSWWLSIMGVGQILLSFGPAYFIYYGVFQQRFFGVFNMLSIFIILGIGADDIFVFLDTWEQSGHKFKGLGKRMSHTWRHAGKAMLVTSLSTIISFMSNANSSFPAIQTFGIFAAMLVLVNYCAVMIYFPTVVFMYETCFAKWKFCCGIPGFLSDKLHKGFELVAVSMTDFKQVEGTDTFVYEEPNEAPINKWFRESYASVLITGKVFFIIMFMVIITVFSIQAAKLEPDPDLPQMLPRSNNYQAFRDKKPDLFARGGSVEAVEITFAWGFDSKNPIDRAGTKATDTDNFGNPVWDPNFSLAKASRCIHSICDKAQQKSDKRKTGGPIDFPIKCFILEFKEYVVNRNGTAVWNTMTGPNADRDLYSSIFLEWLDNPRILSEYKEFIYGEDVKGGEAVLRFVTAELKLTVENSIDADEGVALWGVWEDWLKEQYTLAPCLEVATNATSFQESLEFAFVRQVLVEEAMNGIFLSVGLAFVVLTIATFNIIVAFFSTVVIACIVICTMGMIVMLGWKLGVLESIGLVMVPGLSVDFVAHLAEAYIESECNEREGRVRDMLARVGISICSGAMSTLGASVFLFFPTIVFFNKFGIMMFMTIGFSLFWALVFFPALMSSPLGPQGNVGNWLYLVKLLIKKIKERNDPNSASVHHHEPVEMFVKSEGEPKVSVRDGAPVSPEP